MAVQEIRLQVEGMTCSGCASSLHKFLETAGGSDVFVDFSSGQVSFGWTKGSQALKSLDKGIADLGFSVVHDDEQPKRSFNTFLIIAILFTFPLLLMHMFHMIPGLDLPFLQDPWLQLVLCVPVFVVGVLHFGKSAWYSLRQGIIHMDVLIFLGSTAAFVYSLIGSITNNPELLFYETSAMIITLVLVGNYIEKRSLRSTRSAIEELSALKADQANRINADGTLEIIAAKDLKQYERVQINEGDVIPADVIITEGEAFVDESMISGESLPVRKKRGDLLIGATIIQSGQVSAQVMRTMETSTLQNIIDLVKQAQREKPKVQRLADRISSIFVPGVISISVLTFLLAYFLFDVSLTKAILNSIAVLVISCPCAMGLATPTAVSVGVGRVSREGILIRSALVLEKLATIRKLVFDKTGTLTSGEFDVQFINVSGEPERNKEIIYQLERRSSHPIAKSILQALNGKADHSNNSISDIKEIKGQGVEGFDRDGNRYFIGKSSESSHDERSVVLYLQDRPLMEIRLSDQLRPNASALIEEVKSREIQPIMLSGDQATQVKQTADILGIDEYYHQKNPEEKLDLLDQLREQSTIAMVGDGINDAAVLAKADVGISLSSASQIAINSADIVVLNDDLSLIDRAIRISRATLTTIKQNLFWAFSYNIVAIPLAALGFLNPMWGALFMTFSDIIVIGNSVRLKYRKLD